jgi:hypothetical protein
MPVSDATLRDLADVQRHWDGCWCMSHGPAIATELLAARSRVAALEGALERLGDWRLDKAIQHAGLGGDLRALATTKDQTDLVDRYHGWLLAAKETIHAAVGGPGDETPEEDHQASEPAAEPREGSVEASQSKGSQVIDAALDAGKGA